MNKKFSSKSFDEQLEDLGSRSCQLIEKSIHKNKPKIERLMLAFSTWLDRKLKQ